MQKFETLIFGNAGGMVKTLADVERFCKTPAKRITVGSITKFKRDGNKPVPPGDVYYFDEDTLESGNSLGLPNVGIEAYIDLLPQMVMLAHAAGMELWASIVGDSFDEILELIRACFACGVDGVEINLACPNVHDKGKTKALLCQDVEAVEELLHLLKKASVVGQLGIKIAPTDDRNLLTDLCGVLALNRIVCEVIAVNTKGGQRFIRDGVDRIAFLPPGSSEVKHVGGQAGKPLREPAVWVHKVLRHYLPGEIRTIGVGGIFNGQDAYDFVTDGAAGFQCATAVMKFGERILADIPSQLIEYY